MEAGVGEEGKKLGCLSAVTSLHLSGCMDCRQYTDKSTGYNKDLTIQSKT